MEKEVMTLFELTQKYANEQMLTYAEFAKESGVSYGTLYGMRVRKPSFKTYRRLADYMGMTAFELRQYPVESEL